ncbi:MAG: MotA/TolQ/ExbB proton channel family protein [Planctomycetota bacterium]
MKDSLSQPFSWQPFQWIRLGMIFAAVALCLTAAAPSAMAQGDDVNNELEGDLPPAEGDGGEGAGDGEEGDGQAAGNKDANADGDKDSGPGNLLAWTFEALGWSYTTIFFALSITLLTLVVMNILSSRLDNICPPDLVEGVEQQLAEGNTQDAAELIRTDESFLGQVVAAGLAKVDRGHEAAVEAMQEVGEEETMKMDHNLSYMALIGNISPMVGLFGTVQGMIAAFQTIANSGTTPKPGDLAMDISTALFTTLAGLAIAIPAISVYNILRNRVQRLTFQVGITSEELLERFEG